MERNDNEQTSSEFSGSSSQQSGTTNDSSYEYADSPAAEPQGMKDRAKNALGTAGDKLADVGSSVREKAGGAKDRLVNALESGAERLRERAQGNGGVALAGATATGTATVADGRMAQVSDKVAGGMQATADFLRDADLDSLKTGVERQVKEHPGRTLLIAVGLGYLIGRAFRSGNQ